MSASGPFENAVAIITGGASGIGAATARAFAREGAAVVIADVQHDLGQAMADQVQSAGGVAIYIHCDVAEDHDVASLVSRTVATFGRLDIAFNNAGIEGLQAPTADCTTDNWQRVMAVNLTGLWLCMKHEIPQMLRQGGGNIVNCASIAGVVGFPGIPAYAASKHAVVGLTKTAALEYARSRIRVNAVCPGVIQTPMIDRFVGDNPVALANLVESEPVGRVGTPEEVASAVLWLCSQGASFTTGHALVVDGGWVAR